MKTPTTELFPNSPSPQWRRPALVGWFFLMAMLCLATTSALAANGTAYYFDVNGTTTGFGSPSGTYLLGSSNVWNVSSAGTGTPVVFPSSSQMTFGAAAGDLASSTFTINCDSFLSINGIVFNSTSANITLNGSGSAYLNAPCSWTVATGSTLNESIANSGIGLNFNGYALTLSGGGTINFNTALGYNSYSSTALITQNGPTVNLKPATAGNAGNSGYTLTSGTLNFANANSFSSLNTGGSGVLSINGGTIDNTSGSANTLANLGGGISIGGSFAFTGTSSLDFGTAGVTMANSPTITISGKTLAMGGSLTGTSTFSIASGAALELNVASGSRDFPTTTYNGAGTLRKTGGGEIVWGPGVATFSLGSGSLIDVQGGTFTGSSYANEVWTSNLSDLNVASGAVFNGSEGVIRVNSLTGSGTVKSGYGSSGSITFGVNNGSGTFNGVIADNTGFGKGNMFKEGSGTQTLAGPNTFTGGLTINAGTVKLGVINAIPGNTYAGDVSVSGILDLNGYSDAINGLNGAGRVDDVAGGGTPTLTVGANGDSGSFSGTISNSTGTVALTKSGGGTQTFSGANAYNGTTTISGGTLALQNTYASSGFSISSGAVLELNVASGSRDSATTTYSGAGTLRKTGNGEIVWGPGVATFSLGSGSLIDVQGGTFTGSSYANEVWTSNLSDLNVASGAVFNGSEGVIRMNKLTGSGTVKSGYGSSGSITFGVNNGSGTFNGVIADNTGFGKGTLVKEGSGTQTLAGPNTYTGNTTISAGTLALGASGVLPSGTTVNLAGGTLAMSTFSSTVNALQASSSLLAKGTWGASGSGANHISAFMTGSGILTVTTGGSSAIFVTSGGASTYGGSVTFTATVTGSSGDGSTPAGTVTFFDGGVSLGTGSLSGSGLVATATLNTSALTVGTHTITASYGGSASYDLSGLSGNYSQVVSKATPSIAGVTASPSISCGTANVSLSGTVSAGAGHPANGETVSVTINGSTHNATIAGGAGGFAISFPTAAIPPSATAYPITYAYAGDANLNAAANNTSTALTVTGIKVPDLTYTNAPGVTRIITLAEIQAAGVVSSQSSPTYSITVVSAPTAGGTVVINGAKNAIKYTYPTSGSPGSDSFTYTISDGSASASGTVTITFASVAGPTISNPGLVGGNPQFTFHGIPGYSYHIQRSPDTTTWTTLQPGVTISNSDGSYTYTDTSGSVPSPSVFYRVSYP